MDFQIGDKVRINPDCGDNNFIEQAGSRGIGIIDELIAPDRIRFTPRPDRATNEWYRVTFSDYRNYYPDWALEPATKPPLMDPDFSLEEIELGNDIYAELNR